MKRNYGVELLRCLLMIGICAIHISARMGWTHVSKALLPCVVAFVFIGGYYGIKFSVKKLFALCLLGVWCAAITAIGEYSLFLRQGGFEALYKLGFRNYRCFWFLHSYVLLMFFAPIINEALTRENALRIGCPILFLVFGWSFAYSFSFMRSFVVGLDGFGEMSGLTLIGIYVFARMFCMLDWERRVGNKIAVCILISTLPLTAVRFGAYDSPVALVVGMALFVIASRVRVENERVIVVIKFLTPSLFAIYLLHVNGLGWKAMPWLVRILRDWSLPDATVFALGTIAVFVVCLAGDFIRRGLWLGIVRSFEVACNVLRVWK